MPKTTSKPINEEELGMEEDDDGKRLRVAWSKDGRPLEPILNSNIEVQYYHSRSIFLYFLR